MIENNILSISKSMFKDRKDWSDVSSEQKEQFFFIFNRYFSKKHSEKSFLLNSKIQDKSLGMDVWFEYMKDKPYPQWFWSKSTNKKSEDFVSEKEFENLRKHLDLGEEELKHLIKHYKDEIIEELEYLKKLTK